DDFFRLMVYEGPARATNKIPAYQQADVAGSGFVAMYRKCVHLGCSVPFFDTSKWLEWPFHRLGVPLNGEYRGPAPRSSTASSRHRGRKGGGRHLHHHHRPPRGTVTSKPRVFDDTM